MIRITKMRRIRRWSSIDGNLFKGVLCFMITGLKSNTSFVIKSCPEKEISGEWLKDELVSLLQLLHENGLNVRAIVCDTHASNISAFKKTYAIIFRSTNWSIHRSQQQENVPSLSYVQTMRFFVRLIAYVLVGNRMPRDHIESPMRYATNFVECPHDASVSSSRLPWDGINLLGNALRLCFTTGHSYNRIHLRSYINQLRTLSNGSARKLFIFIFLDGISSQLVIRIIFKVMFPKNLFFYTF